MITACVDVKVTMLRSMRNSLNMCFVSLNDLLKAFDDVEYVLRDGSFERNHPECGAKWRAMYNMLKTAMADKTYGDMGNMASAMGYVSESIIAINCNDPNYTNQIATALNKIHAFEDFVSAYRTYVNTLVAQRNSLCTVINQSDV